MNFMEDYKVIIPHECPRCNELCGCKEGSNWLMYRPGFFLLAYDECDHNCNNEKKEK